MSNFVALTPPLGQQPWGPVNILAPAAGANTLLVAVPANVSLTDFGYPPLNCVFRAVILSKYPGTIFPDPDLQDVFPCPDPDPVHIQELWVKYDDVLGDGQTTAIARLPALLEREISVYIAEFDASQGPTTVVVAGVDMMEVDMAKSKKRARRDTSGDNASEKKMPPPKKAKNRKKPKQIPAPIPTMKPFYDADFPVNAVFDQDMPVYHMAKNYIDNYVKSNEKYAERVRGIIANQGLEPITQRCAKFFAWGLKQPIPQSNAASQITNTATPTPTVPAQLSAPRVTATATPIRTVPVQVNDPQLTAAATSTPTVAAQFSASQATTAEKSIQEKFEHWEYHVDASMREASEDTEPFPDYEEPDMSEYMAIIDDIYNYGADGSVGDSSDDEEIISIGDEEEIISCRDKEETIDVHDDEEIINVRPLNQKPSIKFKASALSTKLAGFIADMEVANKKLEESVRSGDFNEHSIEIGEEVEGEYIEMNLGLGVLEEKYETSEDGDDEAEVEKSVLIEEV